MPQDIEGPDEKLIPPVAMEEPCSPPGGADPGSEAAPEERVRRSAARRKPFRRHPSVPVGLFYVIELQGWRENNDRSGGPPPDPVVVAAYADGRLTTSQVREIDLLTIKYPAWTEAIGKALLNRLPAASQRPARRRSIPD